MHTPVVLAPAALRLATQGCAASWLARGRTHLQRLAKAQRAHTHCTHTSSTQHTTHRLAATQSRRPTFLHTWRHHSAAARWARRDQSQLPRPTTRATRCTHTQAAARWQAHNQWQNGRTQPSSSSSPGSDGGPHLRPSGTWHGPARLAGSRPSWLAAARPAIGASASACDHLLVRCEH